MINDDEGIGGKFSALCLCCVCTHLFLALHPILRSLGGWCSLTVKPHRRRVYRNSLKLSVNVRAQSVSHFHPESLNGDGSMVNCNDSSFCLLYLGLLHLHITRRRRMKMDAFSSLTATDVTVVIIVREKNCTKNALHSDIVAFISVTSHCLLMIP